jgi:hypothetical protein
MREQDSSDEIASPTTNGGYLKKNQFGTGLGLN